MRYFFSRYIQQNLIIHLLFLSTLSIFLEGCKESCTENPNTNLINLEFINRVDGAVLSLALDIRGIDLVTNQALDSALFSQNDTLSFFQLPVSSIRDTVMFQLQGSVGVQNPLSLNERLVLVYNRQVNVIEPECGVSEFISNLRNDTLATTFPVNDVSVVLNTLVNESSEINVQITLDAN